MNNKFIKDLIKASGSQYAALAADGIIGDSDSWIDTGSYVFNALVSGSIYKGIPGTKVTMLGGEESVGKTWFAISLAKSFLEANPTGYVFAWETESAFTEKMLDVRGIDKNRFVVAQVNTVQEFRVEVMKVLEQYEAYDEEEEKPPMLFLLDSLGNLSTNKEMDDMVKGDDKSDMTRAKLLRGTFRALTLKMARNKIPMIMTNHVYIVTGAYVPTKEQGGGLGGKYAASLIVFLSKSTERDTKTKELLGNIIKITTEKSRYTKEKEKVETFLSYETGMDRYYGLLPLAVEFGIVQKGPKKYVFPDGSSYYENEINETPSVWTKEILDEIDKNCRIKFELGIRQTATVEEDEEDDAISD